MFKGKDITAVNLVAILNEQTGYGIHASRLVEALVLSGVKVNLFQPGERVADSSIPTISLFDAVTAQHVKVRQPYPSILYNVWESTQYPQGFMDNLGLYDELWVPSEWQKRCSADQGIDETQIHVVPEGVDPDAYSLSCNALLSSNAFTFLICAKWEPRKYSKEMIDAWLTAFPADQYPDVRLQVAADTHFHCDPYKSTEERFQAYGFDDPRIEIIHFSDRDAHISRLKSSHVFLSCSRAEGWNLPLIEAMACGTPAIALDWSGSNEYADGAIKVRIKEFIKPFGLWNVSDCPGLWAEPDFDHLVDRLRYAHDNFKELKRKAILTSARVRHEFSWKAAANKAIDAIKSIPAVPDGTIAFTPDSTNGDTAPTDHAPTNPSLTDELNTLAAKSGYKISDLKLEAVKSADTVIVIGCWPDNPEKVNTLRETIEKVRKLGHPICISTHYPCPPDIPFAVDYYLYDKKNVTSDPWRPTYTRRNQAGEFESKECSKFYHGVACINAIRNAAVFLQDKFSRMIFMEYDLEFDLDGFMSQSSSTPATFINYESTGIRSDLFSISLGMALRVFPEISSWAEYMEPGYNYVLENWLVEHMQSLCIPLANNPDITILPASFPVTNKYDQVDREIWADDVFSCHFVEGPYLHISGISNREYKVTYSHKYDENVFTLNQKVGHWSRPSCKYFRDWTVNVCREGKPAFHHDFNLIGKRVLISLGSKALGDTLAWVGYIDEFRKKHNCTVICSTWWNHILDYPEIEFVSPGSTVPNLYASYEIGCYDNDLHRNVNDWRVTPLQYVAADILDLERTPIRTKLKAKGSGYPTSKPYVCISEFSTMQGKLWNNPGAWQVVVDYLNARGYAVVSISKEPTKLKNVIPWNGKSIHETIHVIDGAHFYIGLSHGPAWIAYCLNIPCIQIEGIGAPWIEFDNPYRINPPSGSCIGCFSDVSIPIDRAWNWCPRGKDYECTRKITPEMVNDAIEKVIIATRSDSALRVASKNKG